MINKSWKKVLTGILCASLFLSETALLDIRVYAAELMPMTETELSENEQPAEELSEENKESENGNEQKEDKGQPGTGEFEENNESENPDEEDTVKDDTKEGEETLPADIMSGEKAALSAEELLQKEKRERLELMSSVDDIAHGVSDYDDIVWVIDARGKLTVIGTGDFYGSWNSYGQKIVSAEITIKEITSLRNMFSGCTNMTSVDLSGLDTSKVTDMYAMFGSCSSLTNVNLSGLDTGNVTTMHLMFTECSSLTDVDLSNLNTGNVTNMSFMFKGCSSLTSVNLNGIDTSHVTYMRGMFSGCSSLTDIDLSGLDVSNVELMDSMFSGCSSLTDIDLSGLDASNVESMNRMFEDCSKLTNAKLNRLKAGNVTDMGYMFYECSNLANIDLTGVDTRSVTDMAYMFYNCGSLTNIDMNEVDTRNVTNMKYMFSKCSNLTDIDMSEVDTGSVTNMCAMFSTCSNLTNANLGGLDTGNVTDMSFMFRDCSKLTDIDLSGVETDNVTTMSTMFYGCDSLAVIDLSSFNADSVKDMGNMLICQNLKTIYTPYNVKCYSNLLKEQTWYNSDGERVKELPQNLSYSVELGRDYIPNKGETPQDIVQDDITVNGKGYAYANFILKNNKGVVQKNARVNYRIDGISISYSAVSDKDGYIAIKSQLLTNTSGKEEKKTIIIKDMVLQYPFGGQTETLNYGVTMNVTVIPISFTQSWDLGVAGTVTAKAGAGVGIKVGVAEAKANLAKAEISGTAGGVLSVEHSVDNGTRNLTLLQNYDVKVAADVKVGPAAEANILGYKPEITVASVGAGASAGGSVGVGLKIEDYNPDDLEQIAQIGTFMLGTQAQAGGNAMLLRLAEYMGFSRYNLTQCGSTLSAEAGVNLLGIELGDAAEGSLLSADIAQTLSYDVSVDLTDLSQELIFSHELNGEIDVAEGSIAILSDSIFSTSAAGNLEISTELNKQNQVQNFTLKKEETVADGMLFGEKGSVVSAAVTYDSRTVDQLKNNIKVVDDFTSGSTQYILGNAQQKLYEQLDSTPIKGSYQESNAEQITIEPKFGLGLELGGGLEFDVGLEGVYSCEYETAGGTYEAGRKYITNENIIKEEVEGNKYSIVDLVGEPLATVGANLAEFLEDTYGDLKEGLKKAYAEVTEGISGLYVHIVTLKESITGSSMSQSYAITAYSKESISALAETYGSTNSDGNEYTAYTIGDPYYIYVTDQNNNEVPDYSEHPLMLTLSYTNEMLESAGLSEAEANNIKIYQYEKDLYGYVCVGGTVNAEKKAVSVEITKPGQYLLAADNAAPTVREIRISPSTNKPLITVSFTETSGFQLFSMKLDDEEVIGETNWNKYYNSALRSFSYQVETELTEGKHTCSVYAVDTAGNAMAAPYQMEFYIGKIEAGDVEEEDIPANGIIPEGIWAAGIKDCTYTGKNITQSIRLYDGTKRLKEKTDYTVSYKNNKAAFTYADNDYKAYEKNLKDTGRSVKTGTFDPAKAPQAVIQMKGNYAGKKTLYFQINPADISGKAFAADDLTVTFTNKKQTPTPILLWNGKAVKYGSDFYIPEYDGAKTDRNAFTGSNTYTLTLTGKKNFTGKRKITLTISNSKKQIAMNKVSVSGIKNKPWTGEPIIQTGVTVKYGKTVLSEQNGDYTVQWDNNLVVGTGTVTFTGTGEDRDGDGYSFIGTKKVTFKVTGTAMNKAVVTGVEKKYAYTGAAIEPKATLTYRANKNTEAVTLMEGIHYTVTYQKNMDKGTATILFTGLASGGYTGTKKQTFSIMPSELGGTPGSGAAFQVSFADTENMKDGVYNAAYLKGGATPEMVVTAGEKILELDKDYKVSYQNNKKMALYTDKKPPTVVVTGKGNYKGSKNVTFSILAKPLRNENGITVTANDKVASTKANGYRQTFKVYDKDGNTLGSGDYDTKTVTYTLIEAKQENGTVTTENRVLDNTSIVPANCVIQITVKGKGVYAGGEATGTYRILQKDHDISSATIQIVSQPYTGTPVAITTQSQFKTDKVFIKIGKEKKELVLGRDIEVVPNSYVKNVNKGTARVTFRGINDFGGSKTVSYKIGTRSIADIWTGIYTKMSTLFNG